jgi:prepilin-type N-terminal cleavage/methylation domain-containing protein
MIMNSQHSNPVQKRGFTLTEILVAMSISVAMGGAAMWFLVEGTRASLKATNTSINDLSQWSIFTAISVDAKTANGMVVYKNFIEDDIKNSSLRLNNNERGNVLILTRGSQAEKSKFTAFTRITGYVYSASTKTLRKFVYDVPPTEQGDPDMGIDPKSLEQILIDNYESFSLRKVADDLLPTSTGVGVFLVRERGQSGILTVETVQGSGSRYVENKKLIDAAFFIRG